MTPLTLRQFVPSEVCLKCDGCCRYKEPDSAWRPKLGQDDKAGLGILITASGILDSDGYINTIKSCGQNFCRFLNSTDNTCGIYAKRPFECSLYPFLLSRTSDAVKVYVHLACPFVQDHMPKADFDEYVSYLKAFFSRTDIREFLQRNKSMFHDYSLYTPELLHLFDLSFL